MKPENHIGVAIAYLDHPLGFLETKRPVATNHAREPLVVHAVTSSKGESKVKRE